MPVYTVGIAPVNGEDGEAGQPRDQGFWDPAECPSAPRTSSTAPTRVAVSRRPSACLLYPALSLPFQSLISNKDLSRALSAPALLCVLAIACEEFLQSLPSRSLQSSWEGR